MRVIGRLDPPAFTDTERKHLIDELRNDFEYLCDAIPLRAGTIAALRQALEPFADIDGEGDEDFPDDTKVTVTFGRTTHYAVTLGDFRRARAALAKSKEAK